MRNRAHAIRIIMKADELMVKEGYIKEEEKPLEADYWSEPFEAIKTYYDVSCDCYPRLRAY